MLIAKPDFLPGCTPGCNWFLFIHVLNCKNEFRTHACGFDTSIMNVEILV